MRAGRGFRNNLLHVSRSGGVDAVFGTIGLFEPDVGSGKVLPVHAQIHENATGAGQPAGCLQDIRWHSSDHANEIGQWQ